MYFDNKHDGYEFSDFFVSKDHGSDWFIFGRNSEKYGVNTDTGKGTYIKICGWQSESNIYNSSVAKKHGWKTRKIANKALEDFQRN